MRWLISYLVRSMRTLFAILFFFLLASCGQKLKEAPPFRIVATDAGFEAPGALAAGMRHIIFENRGSKIHEAMLVRLAKGMTPDDYQAAVKKGESFPKGALDYSGPGSTSPGRTAEMWLKVDPGNYVLICWNHPKTVKLHAFSVEDMGAPDHTPPKEDVVIRLIDYRFDLSHPLRKGTQVIRVETPGPSMRHPASNRVLSSSRCLLFRIVDIGTRRDSSPPALVAALLLQQK